MLVLRSERDSIIAFTVHVTKSVDGVKLCVVAPL